MGVAEIFHRIYQTHPHFEATDFIIGEDSFEDIQISTKSEDGFWYFKNNKKGLIKRFILLRTGQVEKACTVTLIKNKEEKFLPRFDFQIWNTTKKANENYSKESIDQNLIKAKVSLDNCYENFLLLLEFIKSVEEINFASSSYAVVDKAKVDIFEDIDKAVALNAFQKKYGSSLSEEDVSMLLDRKAKLEYFKKLLDDKDFFERERVSLGETKRNEDVWQNFFEQNQWIFGYGLQLISCEGLDDKKLEQTVVGTDLFDGSGKRADALLKTKGKISKILFCEIKNHFPNLLVEPYPSRSGVYVPAKDLRGAVAQVQKTIHKASLKVQQSFRPTDEEGNPTGEEILFVKPRGIVIIGVLSDFIKEQGINYEELSSFEIYRQQINGIEIITYDELYERAKFIVCNQENDTI